jgi:ATP-dependent Lhr-like helicase
MLFPSVYYRFDDKYFSDIMTGIYEFFLKSYKSFTEIQKLAIPIIESGRNCLIVAPTGSGKTEAAVLPLINSFSREGDPPIKILYITPLRALNRDMLLRLEGLCSSAGMKVGVRHGDTTQSERGKQARAAPDLLITTPETLQSILPTKLIGLYLRNLKAVIIDEVHELYYNKRGAQLSVALERLEELAPGFQRIGISATIGDVEVAKRFICNNRECKVAKVEDIKRMELSVEQPAKPHKRLSELEERFNLDDQAMARLERISDLVSKSNSSLIFANTRQIVESLGSRLIHLEKLRSFGGIGVHHSSLDKEERIKLEREFKSHQLKSIIATSSLELGIDIGSVDLVIQYGSPRQALRLAQRVGRSGHTHRGISRGVVISTNAVETLEALSLFRLAERGEFEKFKPQFGALDVLANQICGILLDKGRIGLEDLERIIKGSFVYREIATGQLVSLLGFMAKQRLVGFDGKNITGGSRTRMYYYSHLSVIPDSKRFVVKNISENRMISSLDEKFVANNVDEGAVFITKGLPWKVISIDKNVISVEPSTDLEAAVPDWSGEDIPVGQNTVQEVFQLLGSPKEHENLSGESLKSVKELASMQKVSFIPSKNTLVIERLDDYSVIYTGLGTQANEALSRLLAHRISARLGRSINIRSSPYMILIEVKSDFDISNILKGLTDSKGIIPALKEAIGGTDLFGYKFITIAKLFGVIERDAVVSKSFTKKILSVMKESPIYEETFRELLENYFAIDVLSDFFDRLNGNLLKINVVRGSSPSILTRTIISSAYYTKELIMPLTPNSELVESFSRFIFSKSVKMICSYCGFSFSRKLEQMKGQDKILCPNCESPMISIYNEEFKSVVEKRKAAKHLNRKERGLLKEMLQYAGLISSYGPKAALALSVYGIGPRSAARILMMYKSDEKSFFIDLLEAQKNFVRTKKYWSV